MKYEPDILYRGMTRPAMRYGMPYQYAVFAMLFYVLAVVKIKSFALMIGLPPILIYIGWELGRRDPHIIKILAIRYSRLVRLAPEYMTHWKARTYGRY